jgi:hypothetical protein
MSKKSSNLSHCTFSLFCPCFRPGKIRFIIETVQNYQGFARDSIKFNGCAYLSVRLEIVDDGRKEALARFEMNE